MRPLLKKSIKDVTQRKTRAILTILGIAIGVLGLTAITTSQGQIASAFHYSEDRTGLPDITFYTTPTAASYAAALRVWNNVKAVEVAGVANTQWKIPSGHKPLQVLGLPNLRNHQMNRFELTSGSWPHAGQILMESSNTGLSPVKVGDRVTVEVNGLPQTVTVSGLVRTRGRPASIFMGTGLAYMPLPDLQRTFNVPGVNYFMISLKDTSTQNSDVRTLGQVFTMGHVTILQTTVGHNNMVRSMTDSILAVMQVLSIVALLLSIFLLISTINTLVAEQVRIIGTMKAIGATRAAVMRNYLTTVGIYGAIGTVLGFILGIGAAQVLLGFIATMFTLDMGAFTVGLTPVLLAIAVGIGVPLLVAIVPIYAGTRLTVREALVGYGLDGEKHPNRFWRGLARALTFIPAVLQLGPRGLVRRQTRALLSFVPGTMQLGVRNLFRQRTRALLTLLALSVSAVAFLSVQTASYSFNSLVTHLMDTYNYDIQVGFTQPQSYQRLRPLVGDLLGVQRVEPASSTLVTTNWGDAQLSGVLPDSTLYKKHMVAGRWFNAADRNVVVISTMGRDNSHLRVGDIITVRDKLHTAHLRVIGVTVDNNGVGLGFGQMMAPFNEVNSFRGLPAGMVDMLMVSSDRSSQAAITTLSRRIDNGLSVSGMQASVMTMKEVADSIKSRINVLDVMLYAVAIIVALIGAIGLFNTLAMSVLERRREIGILRSMGATGRKVAGVFWTEAMSLGALAWVVGVVLGIPAAYGFVWLIGTLMMQVPFDFNPIGIVLMLAVIAVIATLASIIPVWGASRLRIAQILRYEG